MSRTATSGLSFWIIASAVSPSEASPITVRPGPSSMLKRSPFLTIGWSSAIKTRISSSTVLSFRRDFYRKHGATVRLGTYLKFAPEKAGALCHAGQAKAHIACRCTFVRRGHAAPIIAYRQHYVLLVALHRDFGLGGLRVFHDVVQ